ncbi:DUF192 domain-containing protein [Metallumcola ferriviriculae]|uniref:DUF192 domain-containing protein n=1 Tax=Metallumcola ferriviriculae TaxID=3039180 RepID=A0AAU0UKV1_9FIRM|nr:DUF192 domain-containing protein [Desulfitibacteraceae bacterium MK1]
MTGIKEMVINLSSGRVLVKDLIKADSFLRRLKGLIPYKGLEHGEGLLLTPCRSVHTCFMCFAIDVLYLDENMTVIAAFSDVGPWRFLPGRKGTRQVLELPAGTLVATGTEKGHRLQFGRN